MLRMVLVRPGQTEYDTQGRIRSRLSLPLTEEGSRQVAEIARQLNDLDIEAVYCGPGQNAIQTAEAVAAAGGVRVKQIEAFANLNAGLWQGKLINEVKQNQPTVYKLWQENPEAVCPPQGETLAVVRDRVRTALDKISKKHHKSRGHVVIVVPEPVASVVRCISFHTDCRDLWDAERRCGWWEIIQYENTPLVSKA